MRRQTLALAGLVLLFVALSGYASWQESVTIDEFRHLATGVYYWQSGDFAFDGATPPLWKMVMALPAYLAGAKPVRFPPLPELAAGWEPWFVATDFMRDNAAHYGGYLQAARMVNLLAAVLCLLLFHGRCRRYFGPTAALFATAFLALSPTFLAHSHYATTDIIATVTLMELLFLLLDYGHRPGWRRLTVIGLLFAGALLCKFSALLLLPLLVLVPVASAVVGRGQGAGLWPAVAGSLKPLVLVAAIILLTVNLFYGFNGSGTTLRQLNPESRSLAALALTPAGSLPLPLPRALVAGFDKQKADSDYAEFPAYLMGKWSPEGFRSYYLVAFGLKESLPFLLLLVGALVMLAWRRGGGLTRRELLLLGYLPLTLFVVLSFLNRLNVGVRYLLPAYPFLCFLLAWLFAVVRERRGAVLLLWGLLLIHLLSVLAVTPHFISYFNELAGGPANGYRYLIDSNVDWGQDLPALKKFMDRQGVSRIQLAYFGHGLPELYGIDYEPLTVPPKPGYAAISVSLLQGHPYLLTYTDPPQPVAEDHFRIMRDLQPVARAGYSILIYRVAP